MKLWLVSFLVQLSVFDSLLLNRLFFSRLDSVLYCFYVILVGLKSVFAHFKLKNEKTLLLQENKKKKQQTAKKFALFFHSLSLSLLLSLPANLYSQWNMFSSFKLRFHREKKIHKIFNMLLLKLPMQKFISFTSL